MSDIYGNIPGIRYSLQRKHPRKWRTGFRPICVFTPMEKVLEHEIERELLTAPPRRVRMTASTALLLATAALLFMVFVYGGGKALAESARAAWLALFGHRS